MKKNKMMRVASVLLVAVLLTTSIISGTFAKYVTAGSATDSARVAKFGVEVTATGTLFDKTYLKAATNTPGGTATDGDDFTGLTVESTNDKVVAPGTKSDATGLKLSVKGAPEVDVKVNFSVSNVKDVFLGTKSGLPDMTGAGSTFDLNADYYPIKYTLKSSLITDSITGTGATITAGSATGTLAQIEKVLQALDGADGIYVDAGTDLATKIGDISLTWEWAFSDTDSSAGTNVDKADTLLGDIAAGTVIDHVDGNQGKTELPENYVTGTNYSTDVSINFTVTVTQVD